MAETKKIVRSEPFVINKNMGSPLAISARDLTPKMQMVFQWSCPQKNKNTILTARGGS